jgi:hypothetical protein
MNAQFLVHPNNILKVFFFISLFFQFTFCLADETSIRFQSSPDNQKNEKLPASRSFFMGFTPWQYSWIEEKMATIYKTIQDHGDIIAHHLDDGIPWPEAFKQKTFHANVEEKLAFRLKQIDHNRHKIYLAVTPLNFKRDGIAGYWAEKGAMDLPDDWKDKSFNDPEVLQAYVNYCRVMIQRFKPDYFAYGIEVNLLAKNNPELFVKFVPFVEKVYKTLKAEFPRLPIFLTFSLDHPKYFSTFSQQVSQLLPYTDLFALSTYPYGLEKEGVNSIRDLPKDWFKQVSSVAGGKKIAIAETGYPGENISIFGSDIKSSEQDQLMYLQFLFNEMQNLNAEFIIWFVPIDYDDLWSVLKWLVFFNPMYTIWKDTGIWDGEVRPRLSKDYWDKWYKLPRTK